MPSILLLLCFSLLLLTIAKSCRLVVFLLLPLEREERCLSIWNTKKQHPSPDVRLVKTTPTQCSHPKKCVLSAYSQSAAVIFFYPLFSPFFTLLLLLSFMSSTVLWPYDDASWEFRLVVIALCFMMIVIACFVKRKQRRVKSRKQARKFICQ